MTRGSQVTYVPDRQGTAAFARGREVSQISLAAARAGAAYGEAIAPVHTGRYAGSFEVEETTVEVGGERRAGAIIRNTAPHAGFVEYRNRDRVLQMAAAFIEQASTTSGGRR